MTQDTTEPEPIELVRQLREALGMFAGAMPISPQEAWEQALQRARALMAERDAAVELSKGRTITKLYEHQLADNERLRAAYARLHAERVCAPAPGDGQVERAALAAPAPAGEPTPIDMPEPA